MARGAVLIVGGGIAGLATAWGLARRGVGPIVLLEREARLGHWSSGRNAGILRTAIHAPATRRLALDSARHYHDLPQELFRHAPGPIFDGCGMYLFEGSPDSPPAFWQEDLQSEEQATLVPASEARARLPLYDGEGARLWWMPRAGRIFVPNLMAALQNACAAAGVELRTQTKVEHLVRDEQGEVIGVACAGGESMHADRIVLAPGAWAQPFARELGLDFPARTTRRHLFYALPAHAWQQTHPIVWDDSAGFYFLGTSDGQVLLSLCDGDDADPDRLIQEPLLARLAMRRAQSSLPGLAPFDWKRALVGVRTVSEDDVPVLGPHPGEERLFWVAALGGHGVTLSLGLAELASEWLQGRAPAPGLQAAFAFTSPERAWSPTRDYAPL
ncbi:MAG: FAD-dependent oxidoreductase [Planctomycetota bacterium]